MKLSGKFGRFRRYLFYIKKMFPFCHTTRYQQLYENGEQAEGKIFCMKCIQIKSLTPGSELGTTMGPKERVRRAEASLIESSKGKGRFPTTDLRISFNATFLENLKEYSDNEVMYILMHL